MSDSSYCFQRTQIMTAKMGPLLGDMEPIVLKIGCNCSVAYRYVLFSSKTACVSAYMLSTATKRGTGKGCALHP
ncbi:hypothetical protein OUZ56_018579 [Daphnia magna]|uniref:Uncharacterized protein n=1 Tax=Daphnia magna TaxID=35525 RepID=A0ABQ9Z982_9CRUS|nr:hypothetical protein OUZ56_018579 [Daphnia magna]